MEEPQTVGGPLKYVYTYDANGNVGQVVDLAAASAADIDQGQIRVRAVRQPC